MSMPRRTVLSAAVAMVGAVLTGPAHAGKRVNQTFFGGVALNGYDPVAYFTDSRPVEGLREYSQSWMGATWRFATARNHAAFAVQPDIYAPQFGGYCAFGIAQNYTADVDPAAWRVVDNRLYLISSPSILADWLQDVPGNIAKARANWPGLSATLAE